MTLLELIGKFNGKYVEVAGSLNAIHQCTDLANLYIRDVLGLPIIEWTDAYDFPSKAGDKYDYLLNTPDGVPQTGDLVIWKPGPGHIAIFLAGDVNSFNSFDQNFPTDSKCHIQQHTYENVVGWLHPKVRLLTTVNLLDAKLEPNDWVNLGVAEKPIDHTKTVGDLIKDLGLRYDIIKDLNDKAGNLSAQITELENLLNINQIETKKAISDALQAKSAAERNVASLTTLLAEAQTEVNKLMEQEKLDLETIKNLKSENLKLQTDALAELNHWQLIGLGIAKLFRK